jgi:hypothetical protein
VISKRTIIGIGVGSAIIAIGIFSLISNLGIQTDKFHDTLDSGKSIPYGFYAPANTPQTITIIGDSFELRLQSPENGLQIKNEDGSPKLFKDAGEGETFDWSHQADGESKIDIKNTGNSELQIIGIFQKSSEPIKITYDIMVIIAGLVIMGFSLGFSIRKPRGF